MSIHVKICGITDPAGVEAAIAAGADAVGFVLDPSPRQVSPSRAAELAETLGDAAASVAVFRYRDPASVTTALGEFRPTLVQADHGSLEEIEEQRRLPVFREGLDAPEQIARIAQGGRFVYEGRASGVGRVVDWRRAEQIARLGQMTLAGGLTPQNVDEAIQIVKPFGVDVSSGIESSPGVKDPKLIREFVAAVRRVEKEMVRA